MNSVCERDRLGSSVYPVTDSAIFNDRVWWLANINITQPLWVVAV